MDKTCDATTAWLDACIASVEFAAFDAAPMTCVDAIIWLKTDKVLDAWAGIDTMCDVATAWLDACIAFVEFAGFDASSTTWVVAGVCKDIAAARVEFK
jgi:hypothetical protein